MSATRRPVRLAAAVSLGLVALITGAAAPAAEAAPPRILWQGPGAVEDEGWRVILRGTVEGRPFSGDYVATVKPDDGTWPAAGACTPATSTAVITGNGNRRLHSLALGDLCAPHPQPPEVAVRYVFTGSFDVYEGRPAGFTDRQGFVEVRVAGDGRGHLTMVGS
jgi:hypothetical protein